MSFCNNCGYLLPVDFKDKIFCGPCMIINAKSYVSKKCDCEFCHNPFSITKSEVQVDLDILDLGEKRRDLGNYQFSKGDFESESEDEDNDGDEDEEFCMTYHLFDSPGIECNDDHDMVSPDECDSQDPDLIIQDDTDPRAYLKDDDTWTLVPTRKRPDNKGGLQEKKFEYDVSKKEDQVSEPLREQWTQEQEKLLRKLITEDTCHIAKLTSGDRRKSDGNRFYVGGVDISFIKGNNVDACACLSVVQMPNLELVYQRMEMIQLTQPYIPGFLAFREVPPLVSLFRHLKKTAPYYMPDVVMVDGNGILHPRGFGLASHLGVMLDMPTIGVAKTLMTAQGITDDEEHKKKKQELLEAGHGFDLISQTSGEVIGKCLRVHDDAPNPIYISVGHKISLESASWIALETSQYRIPEPVRRADLDSREYIRQNKNKPQEYIKF